jgi:hypothetical protein
LAAKNLLVFTLQRFTKIYETDVTRETLLLIFSLFSVVYKLGVKHPVTTYKSGKLAVTLT